MSALGKNSEMIKKDWATNPRWVGIERPYTADDVVRLRGTVQVEHTLARLGAERPGTFCRPNPTYPAWAP